MRAEAGMSVSTSNMQDCSLKVGHASHVSFLNFNLPKNKIRYESVKNKKMPTGFEMDVLEAQKELVRVVKQLTNNISSLTSQISDLNEKLDREEVAINELNEKIDNQDKVAQA